MQIVRQNQYGGPEVLNLEQVAVPDMSAGHVIVRVRAVAVTAPDAGFRQGSPAAARLMTGLFRPKGLVLGGFFAGVIEAVADDVTRFSVGQAVFGSTPTMMGAMAQFIRIPQAAPVIALPASLDPAGAAGLAYGFLASMPILRDSAAVKPGDAVLVIGASGSLGVAAIQAARHLGAHVSARNTALVASLGAEATLDYAAVDLAHIGERYDVIFDAVAKSSFAACKPALKPGGLYLTAVPSLGVVPHMFGGKASKRARMPATAFRSPGAKTQDLELLASMADAGQIVAVTDRRYGIDQIRDAHRYVDTGRKVGDVVVEMA